MGLGWLAPVAEMAGPPGASGNWPLPPEPGPRAGMCRPKVATRTPGTDAGSVRAARDFTIATLQRWGATDRREDIAIVVSELLTNALRHALPGPGAPRPRCPFRLGLLSWQARCTPRGSAPGGPAEGSSTLQDLARGTVRASQLTFEYLTQGDGPLALCVHGFPGSPCSYRYLLPALAEAGYRAAPFNVAHRPRSYSAIRE